MRVRSVKFEDELDEFRVIAREHMRRHGDGEESSGEANVSLQEGMSKLQLVPDPGSTKASWRGTRSGTVSDGGAES